MARPKEYLVEVKFNHSASGRRITAFLSYYPDSIGDRTAWRVYWDGHPMLTKCGEAGYSHIGHASKRLKDLVTEYSGCPETEKRCYTTEAIMRRRTTR